MVSNGGFESCQASQGTRVAKGAELGAHFFWLGVFVLVILVMRVMYPSKFTSWSFVAVLISLVSVLATISGLWLSDWRFRALWKPILFAEALLLSLLSSWTVAMISLTDHAVIHADQAASEAQKKASAVIARQMKALTWPKVTGNESEWSEYGPLLGDTRSRVLLIEGRARLSKYHGELPPSRRAGSVEDADLIISLRREHYLSKNTQIVTYSGGKEVSRRDAPMSTWWADILDVRANKVYSHEFGATMWNVPPGSTLYTCVEPKEKIKSWVRSISPSGRDPDSVQSAQHKLGFFERCETSKTPERLLINWLTGHKQSP